MPALSSYPAAKLNVSHGRVRYLDDGAVHRHVAKIAPRRKQLLGHACTVRIHDAYVIDQVTGWCLSTSTSPFSDTHRSQLSSECSLYSHDGVDFINFNFSDANRKVARAEKFRLPEHQVVSRVLCFSLSNLVWCALEAKHRVVVINHLCGHSCLAPLERSSGPPLSNQNACHQVTVPCYHVKLIMPHGRPKRPASQFQVRWVSCSFVGF